MNEAEPAGLDQEYDKSQFPERVGGKILPSTEVGYVEVEITDVEGRGVHGRVPLAATQSFKVPNLITPLGADEQKIFENGLASGLIDCRIIERLAKEHLVRIELPDRTRILVPMGSLARPKA